LADARQDTAGAAAIPEMIVVPMKPTPITMIRPALRSPTTEPGGGKGISHAELSAFCSELAHPSAR
jgi:hypothetical protein